jgi:Xaa-Pro aminopeptidase
MLDTGATLNGYFCDFDRNYAVGTPTASAQRAYTKLYDATDAAMEIARPGVRACDLFAAMAKSMDTQNSDVGRFGHGLGMQLTEWPITRGVGRNHYSGKHGSDPRAKY